jgi:RNA polymerase-binding transcription factor DksA
MSMGDAVHYRYFTLEQRDSLERAMRAQIGRAPELASALERLRQPDYGTCDVCGTEMPYVQLIELPGAVRCPACRATGSTPGS